MAGYSGTPLIKKLGIQPQHRMLVVNAPEGYWDWISPLPDGVKVVTKPAASLNFIHLFETDLKAFQKEVLRSKKALVPNGMIWVSWPKKSSKVLTDIDENLIRDYAIKNGLVDVKVCAVNEIWSGLKLVIPIKYRNPQLPIRN